MTASYVKSRLEPLVIPNSSTVEVVRVRSLRSALDRPTGPSASTSLHSLGAARAYNIQLRALRLSARRYRVGATDLSVYSCDTCAL